MSYARSKPWVAAFAMVALVAVLPACGGGGNTTPSQPPQTQPPQPQTQTFFPTDVPRAIPDLSTINSTVNVGGMSGTITAATVNLSITHTFIGDLVVSVRSPGGSTSTIHNRSGGSQQNLVGSFVSSTAFTGQQPNGTWTLIVSDQAARDVGTLNAWNLTLTTR